MSFQAQDPRTPFTCKICGEDGMAEFAYQDMGVCSGCVGILANMFWKEHSGQPHPDFAWEEFKAHREAMRPAYIKETIGPIKWEV